MEMMETEAGEEVAAATLPAAPEVAAAPVRAEVAAELAESRAAGEEAPLEFSFLIRPEPPSSTRR